MFSTNCAVSKMPAKIQWHFPSSAALLIKAPSHSTAVPAYGVRQMPCLKGPDQVVQLETACKGWFPGLSRRVLRGPSPKSKLPVWKSLCICLWAARDKGLVAGIENLSFTAWADYFSGRKVKAWSCKHSSSAAWLNSISKAQHRHIKTPHSALLGHCKKWWAFPGEHQQPAWIHQCW